MEVLKDSLEEMKISNDLSGKILDCDKRSDSSSSQRDSNIDSLKKGLENQSNVNSGNGSTSSLGNLNTERPLDDKKSSNTRVCSEVNIICHHCKERIDGKFIRALNKNWHQDHFTCEYCKEKISDNFFEYEQGVICEACALEKFMCCECGKIIEGAEIIYPDGRVSHKECAPEAVCAYCNKVFSLVEAHVKALDRVYHVDCFVCSKCHKLLGNTFLKVGELPYCQKCLEEQ